MADKIEVMMKTPGDSPRIMEEPAKELQFPHCGSKSSVHSVSTSATPPLVFHLHLGHHRDQGFDDRFTVTENCK